MLTRLSLRLWGYSTTTPLFLLRAVELGLSGSDLSLLTIGLVNDMFTEKNNDEYKYKEVATQEDYDKF